MADRILEVEHRPGEEVVLRFRAPKVSVLPDQTREHIRVVQKETLLALRSLLDRAIERVEEAEKTRTEGRTKINIE